MGIPGREERERRMENLFKKKTDEDFQSLWKKFNIHVQEATRTPNAFDTKRPSPKHTILKLSKVNDKERILKRAREKKTVAYEGNPIKLSADFSGETLQARGAWNNILNILITRNHQPRVIYPSRLPCKNEGKTKAFPDKQKWREFTITYAL